MGTHQLLSIVRFILGQKYKRPTERWRKIRIGKLKRFRNGSTMSDGVTVVKLSLRLLDMMNPFVSYHYHIVFKKRRTLFDPDDADLLP